MQVSQNYRLNQKEKIFSQNNELKKASDHFRLFSDARAAYFSQKIRFAEEIRFAVSLDAKTAFSGRSNRTIEQRRN